MRSALWVLGTLVIAIAAGLGVWKVMKDQRSSSSATDDDATHVDVSQPPAMAPPPPSPTPAPVPVAPEIDAAVPAPREMSVAESRAVDPTDGSILGIAGGDDGLDAGLITRQLAANVQRFGACQQGGSGKLRVRLTLNRRGGVTAATSDGSATGDCLAAELKKYRWGKAFDGAEIVIPFDFQAVCDEVSCVLDNYEGYCCAKFYKGPPRRPVEPSADGLPESLDRAAISEGVSAVKAKLMACGESSPFKGTVRARVHVTPQGAPDVRSLDDAPPELADCMRRTLAGARFPMTKAGASFSYPFVF